MRPGEGAALADSSGEGGTGSAGGERSPRTDEEFSPPFLGKARSEEGFPSKASGCGYYHNLERPHFGKGMEGRPPFQVLRQLGCDLPHAFALFPPTLVLDRISVHWAFKGVNDLLVRYKTRSRKALPMLDLISRKLEFPATGACWRWRGALPQLTLRTAAPRISPLFRAKRTALASSQLRTSTAGSRGILWARARNSSPSCRVALVTVRRVRSP